MHYYGFVTANVFIFVILSPVGSKGQMFEGQEEENTLLEDPNLWPATYFGSMGVGFLIFFLMMFLLYLAMRKEIRAASKLTSSNIFCISIAITHSLFRPMLVGEELYPQPVFPFQQSPLWYLVENRPAPFCAILTTILLGLQFRQPNRSLR